MRLVLAVVSALALCGQDAVKQGAEVFAKSCASGYCHGGNGAGGGAPRLSGRGFDQAFIAGAVSRGVTGTAMPAFAATLSRTELASVVAYVGSLNGVVSPSGDAGAGSAGVALAGEAARGRTLFSEAVRGFGRCSTCHEVQRTGIPVAPPMTRVPADFGAFRNLQTPNVMTAAWGGENIPVLMVSRKPQAVVFYDLSSVPPVLRTVLPAEIQTRDGSSWAHSAVAGGYSQQELSAVLAYLRAVVQ